MAYPSLESIVMYCQEHQVDFFEAIIVDDCDERKASREESFGQMRRMWEAMREAADSYDRNLKSASGLVGGQGHLMEQYRSKSAPLCGDFMAQVIEQALEMGESNACMKRIVAAPTAGACGVLPAVLIPYYRNNQVDEELVIKSLYVAAGIGQVIATRAFIAGAAGGCQAEVGAASSMAAGAMVYLRGGSAYQIAQAAAMALKNLLGLVCDPVAGLVEVPCVKRGVIGAVGAMAAADMALAGIVSRIPADQVIDAMREVGEKMDVSLKETGEGGLAASTAGVRMREALDTRQ